MVVSRQRVNPRGLTQLADRRRLNARLPAERRKGQHVSAGRKVRRNEGNEKRNEERKGLN